MERTANKLETQIQFWTLIGPILMVMTLLAVMIKGEVGQWSLSLIAILGIPLCWKWKMKGLLLSLACLTIVFIYQMSSVSFDDRFWISALSLTIGTTFVVTALSFKEVSSLVKALEIESKSRLDNLFMLDEKFKEMQSAFQQEHALLVAKVNQSQVDIEEKQQQIHSYEKLVSVVKEEILSLQERQEALLKEVFDKRHEAMLLQQKVEELQGTLQSTALIEDKSEELKELQQRLEAAKEEIQNSHKQIEEYALELSSLKEMNDLQESVSLKTQEEQILHQAIVQEMNEHCEGLSREKSLLEHTLARLQTELDALMLKEERQSQTLESQLNSLQELNASLQKKEEELRHEKLRNAEEKAQLEDKLKGLNCQIDELTSKWSHSAQQISHWQQRVADYEILREKSALHQSQLQAALKNRDLLLKELEEKSLQLLTWQQEQEKQTAITPLSPEEQRFNARAQAMYLQLREQFEEKSAVLDETRRELFKTQESLLRLQKEMEETHIYDINETEATLQHLLLSMEEELKEKEVGYQNEIDALHHVIASLI